MRRPSACAIPLGCLLAAACGSGSSSPTTPSAARPGVSAPPSVTAISVTAAGGPSIFGASVADFVRCLHASGDAVCFTGARPVMRVVTAGATAPAAPGTLTATASGNTVTLTWGAPASGDPVTTYIIEAGSGPGLSNLASFATGDTATTFSTGGVPDGTYYVRIKAQNTAGTSAASNEATLVVGAAACASPPGAPTGLTSTVTGRTITLTWNAPSGGCPATSFILQAGSTPGSSALANSNVGNVTRLVATDIGNGSYYVRVAAANAFGQSAPSNEIVATVALQAGAISVTVTPNPVPFSGTPIAATACVGVPNTWFYTETIRETAGVAVTLTKWVSVLDGRSILNQGTVNSAISAHGSTTFNFNWCLSAAGQHTIQTTWSGTDANGNSFSYGGPIVTLLANSTTTTTGKRTFPAVWVSASWIGGRTGTPLSSRGIDPTTHFGTLCLANSITLKNHPDPNGSYFHSDDSLFALNTGCSAPMTTVAFCRTSGSGGGASSIPICATDPRETPLSNLGITAVGRSGAGTWIGTTPINFDVNVFWCSDQSTFNYDRRVPGKPLLECVEN
ncbi:MAG: fibronectin type III domain-containing protein [Acidobacteria bacterium]|nr:fibronectin type III domain-containing protein [Acidobacteriota bacterium]